jgi:hypothetical protein
MSAAALQQGELGSYSRSRSAHQVSSSAIVTQTLFHVLLTGFQALSTRVSAGSRHQLPSDYVMKCSRGLAPYAENS